MKVIEVMTRRPILTPDRKHHDKGTVFTVTEKDYPDLLKGKEAKKEEKDPLKGDGEKVEDRYPYLEIITVTEIDDAEVEKARAEEAAVKANNEAIERSQLMDAAKRLGIRGVRPGIDLAALRKKVEVEKAKLVKK